MKIHRSAAPLLATAAIGLATIAAPALGADDQPPSEDLLAAARPAIEAANADWVPAMKRKDARAIAAAYAPDGVLVTPAGDAIAGREAVERFYAKRMEAGFRFVRGILVQDGVVLVAGPLIYEWGHADIEVERDGRTVRSTGNYLTVWKRNGAGTWQISRNLAL